METQPVRQIRHIRGRFCLRVIETYGSGERINVPCCFSGGAGLTGLRAAPFLGAEKCGNDARFARGDSTLLATQAREHPQSVEIGPFPMVHGETWVPLSGCERGGRCGGAARCAGRVSLPRKKPNDYFRLFPTYPQLIFNNSTTLPPHSCSVFIRACARIVGWKVLRRVSWNINGSFSRTSVHS